MFLFFVLRKNSPDNFIRTIIVSSSKLPTVKKNGRSVLEPLKNHRQGMFGGGTTSSRNNSNPASPAITPVPMKRDANAIKQQALKRSFIHLLAVRAVSEKYMASVLHASTTDLVPFLGRYGKRTIDGSKYNLSDRGYKELDPWTFPYKDESDRNGVIERAITAFDRLRISVTDPLWQKLLRVEERGKGKTLSKLSNLCNGPVERLRTPKNHIETPSSSVDDANSTITTDRRRHLAPSDVKMRSKSEDTVKKTAVLKSKDIAQTKGQKKIEVKKPISKKSTAGKVSGTSTKVKSAEFIDDSDEEIQADEIAVHISSSQHKDRPASSQEKLERKDNSISQQQNKRKAEDDISTSAKKTDVKKIDLKKKTTTTSIKPIIEKIVSKTKVAPHKSEQVVKKFEPVLKQSEQVVRTPDQVVKKAPDNPMKRSTSSSSSQLESRTGKKRIQESQRPIAMARSVSAKKGTSPVKPSPLGSSPPTNASDLQKGRGSNHNPTKSSSSSSSGSPLINQRRERLQLEAKRSASKILPSTYNPGQSLKRRADEEEAVDNGVNRGLSSASSSDQSSSKRPRLSGSSASTSESDQPSITTSSNTSPSVGLSTRDLDYARSFKFQWQKYNTALCELQALSDPPPERVEKLQKLREKLVEHKATICSWDKKDAATVTSL